MRQKVFSLGEKFKITDIDETPRYFVEGSFLEIPKRFKLFNDRKEQVGEITKKVLSFLPSFYVNVNGYEDIVIQKAFTLFRAKFNIHSEQISVTGDILDKHFEVMDRSEVIAHVEEKWFTWGDTYKIDVKDPKHESLVIALVVAIDFAKQEGKN